MTSVPYTIVDSAATLSTALCSLVLSSVSDKPALYVDLEGINLCRNGSISIVQIYQSVEAHVYLIDVHTLSKTAFSTTSADGGITLKDILESRTSRKAFFDVRNDSDALYNLYDVYLQGVVDIQLMELRSRSGSKRFVNGLARCLESYFTQARLYGEFASWKEAKQAGIRLFAPEHGGTYQVFNDRPMTQAIIQYCVQDVTFLPQLYDDSAECVTPTWQIKLNREALRRVAVCQQALYQPNGRQKALAPIFT